jgi:hypothetical protein
VGFLLFLEEIEGRLKAAIGRLKGDWRAWKEHTCAFITHIRGLQVDIDGAFDGLEAYYWCTLS